MRRPPPDRFWVALLTLVLIVVLRPLAQASPDDPLWIAGFYDGADFDDVVSFLVTYSGLDAGRQSDRPSKWDRAVRRERTAQVVMPGSPATGGKSHAACPRCCRPTTRKSR